MKSTATFPDGSLFRFEPFDSVERNECLPGAIEALHRDRKGYVLVRTFTYLDGRQLGPEEEWARLAPELARIGADELRIRRMRYRHEARRISLGEAVRWCTKVCLPRELAGYVLDSLQA